MQMLSRTRRVNTNVAMLAQTPTYSDQKKKKEHILYSDFISLPNCLSYNQNSIKSLQVSDNKYFKTDQLSS